MRAPGPAVEDTFVLASGFSARYAVAPMLHLPLSRIVSKSFAFEIIESAKPHKQVMDERVTIWRRLAWRSAQIYAAAVQFF